MTDSMDLVIAEYKKDVDRTLIRENLKMTHEERFEALLRMVDFLREVRSAGKALRGKKRQ